MSNKIERLTTAQWVLERQLAWIASAEVKVGVVITLNVAMLGGLAAAASSTQARSTWMLVFAIASAVLTVVALGCAAYSIKPRTDGPAKSMLFFGRIVEHKIEEFVERFKDATDDDLLADWTEQIHRNAEIAKTKHQWVARAMTWSFLGAIPWVLAITLLVK